MQSESIGRHPVPRVAQRTPAQVRISGGVHQVVVDQVGIWQPAFRSIVVCGAFSRRECELSVTFLFVLPCHIFIGSKQNQSFLASRCNVHGVVTPSCVHRTDYHLVLDIIWGF